MSLIVAGTVRVPPDAMDKLRPHAAEVVAATRGEDGCLAYNFSEDLSERGLIHIFEVWRDRSALEAHFETAHMARWRSASAGAGLSDRKLVAYEIASERTL